MINRLSELTVSLKVRGKFVLALKGLNIVAQGRAKRRQPPTPPWVRCTQRKAFTLLELLLALSLSVVILMAIGMAIHLHLRSLDSRRTYLEESQLARSVLRIVADDIRSVALRYEQDVSGIEELLKGAAASAVGDLAGGSLSNSGSGSGGVPTSGVVPTESGAETGAGETDPSANTADLSTTVALPTMPGIYGNQYQLQIDVSRLPRIDEYQQMVQTDPLAAVRDIPSDVKTVTYYLQSATTSGLATAGTQGAALTQLTDPNVTSGLVRRELDRAVTNWTMTNNSAAMVSQTGEVLAPEVVNLEFQYFDGYEWRLEWDTETEQALPLAIQISLAMQSMKGAEAANTDVFTASAEPLTDQTDIRYYRLVVQLPVGMPAKASEPEDLGGTGL